MPGQCAIQEPDTNTVVLTGRQVAITIIIFITIINIVFAIITIITCSQVAMFGPGGLLAYLTDLNQHRMNHACRGYYDADGSKVMLVAGG